MHTIQSSAVSIVTANCTYSKTLDQSEVKAVPLSLDFSGQRTSQ